MRFIKEMYLSNPLYVFAGIVTLAAVFGIAYITRTVLEKYTEVTHAVIRLAKFNNELIEELARGDNDDEALCCNREFGAIDKREDKVSKVQDSEIG